MVSWLTSVGIPPAELSLLMSLLGRNRLHSDSSVRTWSIAALSSCGAADEITRQVEPIAVNSVRKGASTSTRVPLRRRWSRKLELYGGGLSDGDGGFWCWRWSDGGFWRQLWCCGRR
jgi:hypothetical protein